MILFLADIHIGVKLKTRDFYNSLDVAFEMFKKECVINKEKPEAIIICGDLFDHALNIDEMTIAAGILIKLALNGCGDDVVKNLPVHIVEGTFSHDRHQMKIFMSLLKEIPHTNVFYYPEWCKVTFPSGKKVLMLPQEYGDIDYTEAFNDNYDLIVGHGPISSKTKSVINANGTEIMHSVEMLSNISKLCVFGHYHEYTDFGNGVYYAGSMLRFRYGEDTDKMIVMCNDNYEIITNKNPVAKEFKTIEVHDPEQLRDALSNNIESPHRFVIHPKTEDDLRTYHAIMNTTKINQNVKFKVISDEQIDSVENQFHEVEKASTTSSVIEPIPSLIDYISEKYKVDTEKEIREYESKIIKEENK